jgi:hypothetical protein
MARGRDSEAITIGGAISPMLRSKTSASDSYRSCSTRSASRREPSGSTPWKSVTGAYFVTLGMTSVPRTSPPLSCALVSSTGVTCTLC